jgi:CRP-like cAMP-binding protein
MSSHDANPDPMNNRILASFAPSDYDVFRRVGKPVFLRFRKRLYPLEGSIDYVYFPITCMISLLASQNGQSTIEMATIGREGVVGASELIQKQEGMGVCIVQLPGIALRIDAAAFQAIASSRPQVRDLIDRHLFALMRQVLYGAACNRLHSMEERCARWLLFAHDRAAQDNFPLTQEFLSRMLGVRRATVNVAIGMLKKAGFIQYVRGHITITDRRGLESAACHCYGATIRAYNSILPTVSATGAQLFAESMAMPIS